MRERRACNRHGVTAAMVGAPPREPPEPPRSARESPHGNSKLTWAEVLEIRAAYTGERGQLKALARQYCVERPTISNIVYYRTWKDEPA